MPDGETTSFAVHDVPEVLVLPECLRPVAAELAVLLRLGPEHAAGVAKMVADVAAAGARGEATTAVTLRHQGSVVVEICVGQFDSGGQLYPRKKWGGKFPAAMFA